MIVPSSADVVVSCLSVFITYETFYCFVCFNVLLGLAILCSLLCLTAFFIYNLLSMLFKHFGDLTSLIYLTLLHIIVFFITKANLLCLVTSCIEVGSFCIYNRKYIFLVKNHQMSPKS